MTEQEAFLVLNAVPELGAAKIRRLVRSFGAALNVLQASMGQLILSNLVVPATAQNIFNFSKDKFLQDEYNLMQQKGLSVLTAGDEAFPCSLEKFEDAPVVLYVKGDPGCLASVSVAMVGSRAVSYHGLRSAKAFAQSFAQAGLTVVSGLARGIDTAAHQGALEAGGKTIGVIGCGFNYIYPKENRGLMDAISRQGAVISEFPCATPPVKFNFPWRNRIISGLSLATVVVEAGRRSGALITADYAMAQNKDVYVLPSNIDTETALGSNQLIQEGALVALNPDDVLYRIKEGHNPLRPQQEKTVLLLSDEQQQVYPHITSQPVHVDELVKRSGLSISSLMNVALSLELKRVIRQLPGQYYVRQKFPDS